MAGSQAKTLQQAEITIEMSSSQTEPYPFRCLIGLLPNKDFLKSPLSLSNTWSVFSPGWAQSKITLKLKIVPAQEKNKDYLQDKLGPFQHGKQDLG